MFHIEAHELHRILEKVRLGHDPKQVTQDLFHSLPAKEKTKILNQDIAELNLSVRVHNLIESAGIRTIRDIVVFSNTKKLCSIKWFGPKCLDEVFDALELLGIDPTHPNIKDAARRS